MKPIISNMGIEKVQSFCSTQLEPVLN